MAAPKGGRGGRACDVTADLRCGREGAGVGSKRDGGIKNVPETLSARSLEAVAVFLFLSCDIVIAL